jgi:hypothetical protein
MLSALYFGSAVQEHHHDEAPKSKVVATWTLMFNFYIYIMEIPQIIGAGLIVIEQD